MLPSFFVLLIGLFFIFFSRGLARGLYKASRQYPLLSGMFFADKMDIKEETIINFYRFVYLFMGICALLFAYAVAFGPVYL